MNEYLKKQVQECEYCVISRASFFKRYGLTDNNEEYKETCRLVPFKSQNNAERGTHMPCDFLIENGECPKFGIGKLLG
jgi:hypothetical protein